MPDTLSYICAAVEYTGQAKRVSAVLRPMLDALASHFARQAREEIAKRDFQRSLPWLVGRGTVEKS